MNLYRSLLISTIIIILVVSTRQQQQACPEGGAFVQDIHSGILELPYNDLNEGTINKNYFEPISEGILNKNKRMALAFSMVSFEGSGRQSYYALMLKQHSLQNQNTRLSITMDFQYPNSNMLSIWTQIRLSYLIVSENLQRNGYSYVWAYMQELELKGSVDSGIVDGDLFNHPNDKSLCGYDGRYWHTDGCHLVQAFPIYHCYISGWKFDPQGFIGIRQLAFSAQLADKNGQASYDEKQAALDVRFSQNKDAGPRLKIDNFDGQMQKIKVSLVMTIIQANIATYPIGTFTLTYSGIYHTNNTWSQGQQIIQSQKSTNLYYYDLPGMKYYIFGVNRFIAMKGLPRQVSIMLNSELKAQNLILVEQNFKLPLKQIMFSADFYYKRIDKICQADNGDNVLQKNRISQMKFENYPSNDTSFLIRSVAQGDMPNTENQSAIEYLYRPNPQIEQIAWVTYTFSNIKVGGSYIFSLSINEIGIDGFADYTGYNFAVYANENELYKTLMIGSPKNDKIEGIQKTLNINNDSIAVKIYTKIYRQESKNIHFRVNLLVKEITKVFNPITQCCNSVCPPQSGINITLNPIQCIICDNQKGFYFNERYNKCLCKKGSYYIEDILFPKCMQCHAALCDMCESKQPKKCIECIFGAELDPFHRTCKCLPGFIQQDNKCLLNTNLRDVCTQYGYCDYSFFDGLIFKPPAPNCVDGMFDNGEGSCSKCNPQCLTCSNTSSCLSCDGKANRVLKNSICVCMQGYFPFEHQNKTRVCLKCASQCQSCQFNPESCTLCDSGKFMQKVVTPKGMFTCECMPGYHSDGQGNCIESNCNADRHCATCEQKLCTSCTKSSNRILQLPEHICACKQGYFESLNRVCERCRSGCAKCNSSSICQSCVILSTQNSDGSCSCPKGTYFNINPDTDIGFCRKCSAMCETCNDQRTCLTCPATYTLSQQNKCICLPGNFVDSNNSLCTQCPEGCAECSSFKQCTKCKRFFHLQESSCVYNCRMGFYITETSCFKCIQGCARCQNAVTCQQCQSNFILYQSRCYKECPQGTIKAVNKSDCIPCNSPCKTCLYHPSHCVSCQNGQGYLHQIGDQKRCLRECPLGMFPSNGACQLCDLNCLSCLGDMSNCIQCPVNQYLFKGRCHQECPGVEYENNCLNFCPDGYYRLEDKKCWPCSEKCLTCERDRQRCLSCRQNSVMKENKCIQQCTEGEFQMKGKCVKCSISCKKCEGQALNCTSCFDNAELKNNRCQYKCLQNQFYSYSAMDCLNCSQGCKNCFSSSQCITCESNYVLNSGKCENLCNYPCHKCIERNQCLSCLTGFYLIERQMECIQFCPKGMRAQNGICRCAYGFYFNRTCHIFCPYQTLTNQLSKTCSLCPIRNCAECQSASICKSCEPSFQISPDHTQCFKEKFQMQESHCPKGFTFMNNSCVRICPQQNFDAFSTIQNGTVCVYGPSSGKLFQQTNSLLSNSLKCSGNKLFENGLCVDKCSIGYFHLPKTRQCRQCQEPCLSCSDQKSCELCQNGHYLIGNRCFSVKCGGSRKFFNGNCVNQCPKGTYFDGEVCQKICPEDHLAFEGFCYLQCPLQSPYKVDFACLQACPFGFTLKGKECI